MPQIWKTQQWPQDWKRSVFIPIPKKGNAKECSNYRAIALISHASKVMLKILQDRFQQYVNWEFPDVQAGPKKVIGTRDQIANICWIIEKARESQKNISFIDYAKAFDYVDHNILWKILKEMGIPDHLTCLLRNLYAGQEAIVRTRHVTMDWFKIGKEVCHGCILSPCLFNFYAEYNMWNAGLDGAQAVIKIAQRIRHGAQIWWWHHTYGRKGRTKETLDEGERGEWKIWLNWTLKKTKITASSPITSWGNNGNSERLYISGLQNHFRWWLQPWN